MPFATEHAARQNDAMQGDYPVRRWSVAGWPAGVVGVWQILDDSMRLLSIRFLKDQWEPEHAKEWLESRKLKSDLEPAEDETRLSDVMHNVPEGLAPCEPMLTLRTGNVYNKYTGQPRNKIPVTLEHLSDMARGIRLRGNIEPVIIDWNHNSDPDSPASANPEHAASLGKVGDGWVTHLGGEEYGLVVQPFLNNNGIKVLNQNKHAIWNSPQFGLGPVYAKESGARVGSAALFSLALTNRPAQTTLAVDPARFTDSEVHPMMDEENKQAPPAPAPASEAPAPVAPEEPDMAEKMAELAVQLKAKDEEILALQAELAKAREELSGYADKQALNDRTAVDVAALKQALADEKLKREVAEDKATFNLALSEGKVSPAEESDFIYALCEKRQGRGRFFDALYGARKVNEKIDFTEQGTNRAPPKTDEMTENQRLHLEVLAFADKYKLDYPTALSRVCGSKLKED